MIASARHSLLLFLAAYTAASPLQDAHLQQEHSRADVTEALLADFKYYAEYSAASYCNGVNSPGQSISCSNSACPQPMKVGAKTVASFSGVNTGIQGFVATDPDREEIIVAIRGSSNVRNWITNFQFLSTSCDLVPGCQVHRGFFAAWNEIRRAIQDAVKKAQQENPAYSVVVTGHSLGGAVATLAAAHLRADGTPADLYTYGAPRVGNEEFVSFVSRQEGETFRITHGSDPVPRVPPFAAGYRHTTPEHWLNGGRSTAINYGVRDVKVCEGTLSLGCNAGRVLPDALSHLYYLHHMSACTGGFDVVRAVSLDDEVEAKLEEMAEMDRQYMAARMNGTSQVDV